MLLPLLQNNVLGTAPTLVTVPNVVGLSQAQGTTNLQAVLFVVAVSTAYSSTVPAGTIISQSPSAGTDQVQGSTVTITVSLGEAPPNSGAGRHRRRPRKYVIRIDGQIFEADSEEQAQQILAQAASLAERAAEKKANEIVTRALPKAIKLGDVKPITIKAPTVQVSDDLQAQAELARAAIAKAYANASAIAEMRLWLALMQAEEDDEEFLLLH